MSEDRLEEIKEYVSCWNHPEVTSPMLEGMRWLISEVERLRAICCRGDDPTCPCHDGDPCHYRGENPWKTPLEKEVERLTLLNSLRPPAPTIDKVLAEVDLEAEVERLRAELAAAKARIAEARDLLSRRTTPEEREEWLEAKDG